MLNAVGFVGLCLDAGHHLAQFLGIKTRKRTSLTDAIEFHSFGLL